MNKLDNLIAEHKVHFWQKSSYLIICLLSLFILWSIFSHLDEVAIANGEVIPQGRVKTIQHLEGGIIEEIFVNEGDLVTEGTSLLQLDLGGTTANFEELEVSLYGLMLKKARLTSEAERIKLNLPFIENKKVADLRKAEEAAYIARQEELESTQKVLEGQLLQRRQEIKEVEARLSAFRSSLNLAEERLKMSEDLMKDQLQSPMEHITIKSEVETLRGEVSTLEETLPRTEASLLEADARLLELNLRFSREAREALGETELNIARTEEIIKTAQDQQIRTTVKSPITGTVKNLRYSTIGGVVRPGEAVMDIVPSEDTLVVEAKLNPIDRGFVRAGQKATVKIDTFDFFRYGGIEGEVEWVAPDSTIAENGQPHFKVMVRTDQPWLGDKSEGFLISPGMGATVDIHTGTKSVISYLIRPVLKLKHESFRER